MGVVEAEVEVGVGGVVAGEEIGVELAAGEEGQVGSGFAGVGVVADVVACSWVLGIEFWGREDDEICAGEGVGEGVVVD